MNKTELVAAVSEQIGVPKRTAEAVVNATINMIIDETANGNGVQLIGFGTFETVKRAARQGRNPQTGETVSVPATVVPKFRPGKAFKDAVTA